MKTQFASALAIALVAGGLAPQESFAQANQGQWQTLEMDRKVEPQRVAKVRRMADGTIKRVTEWQRYVRPTGTDIQTTPAFDAYEGDSLANPVGFCESGCTQVGFCPAAGPSSRWWGGATYNAPLMANDMTVPSEFNGGQSTRAWIAWNWGPTVPTQMFVAIFTSETLEPCGGATATSGDYDGIILDFGLDAGGAGYFISDVDLSIDPTLFWQLPMDGSGAYIQVIANAEDPVTGALTIDTTPGTQFMVWGTGEDETPPDGRVGTQGIQQYDDDAPPDAVLDPIGECYDYIAAPDQCPVELGAMILFMGEAGTGPTCYANCDNSTVEPVLNVADFGCFLQAFAQGTSYANCDNSTLEPVLNVADFSCFLQEFAQGCP